MTKFSDYVPGFILAIAQAKRCEKQAESSGLVIGDPKTEGGYLLPPDMAKVLKDIGAAQDDAEARFLESVGLTREQWKEKQLAAAKEEWNAIKAMEVRA